MSNVIQFPNRMSGIPIENEKARVNHLKQRLAELEKRIAHFSEDIEYIQACVSEDTHEMSLIITELAGLHGFTDNDVSPYEIADTLQRWLEGDDDEDR